MGVLVTQDDQARFWSKVDIADADVCWNWKAGTFRDGYGQFHTGGQQGKNWVATRWLWTFLHGPIPNSLCVLHRCDNPRCCNPSHLFLGTNLDNIHDRDAKGRQVKGDLHWARTHPEKVVRGDRHYAKNHPELVARGDRHGTRLHPETVAPQKGEAHGMARLHEYDVIEIRRLRASGLLLREIAARFNLSEGHVSNIVRGKMWSHIK